VREDFAGVKVRSDGAHVNLKTHMLIPHVVCLLFADRFKFQTMVSNDARVLRKLNASHHSRTEETALSNAL
jgi:hypothetical protein